MSVQVTNLSKRYENNWVLRDVSFAIEPGEVVAIFSDSALSGTALLKLIGGEESSNGGTIATDGMAPKRIFLREKIKGLGLFGLQIGRSSDNSVHSIKVDEIDNAMPGTLLLLEAPYSSANVYQREKIRDSIKTAAANGSAVLFTTNDFNEALEFSNRALIIMGTVLEQDAPPQEIYELPTTIAIARIAGRNNLINARRLTSSKSDSPEFITIEGEHRLFAQRTERVLLGALNRNITLAIRPEQISISFGASFPEDNLLKATVTRVQPLGPTTRVEFDCGGLKLEAMVVRLVGLNIGEECMVGLPPDRIAILAN
jgi:ABC-type Fe3+/spermidine/putrescine transport system ATPase subunit